MRDTQRERDGGARCLHAGIFVQNGSTNMTTYQRFLRTTALALNLTVITAASGFAQTSLATLRGKASDEQGGVLPGATVTVRQIETNATKVGVTGEVGQYYLPSLPAGTYEVTVELSGFTTG